ncbi:hypothetical protein FRC07_007251, partial [Ceratobasidium sp. 392]
MLFVKLSLLVLAGLRPAAAVSTGGCVSFDSISGGFQVTATGNTQIPVAPDEWPGVVRAAEDFAKDLNSVTGKKLSVTNATITAQSKTPIIVGTLGHSALISAIVNNTKLDVSSISGKWESFIAQPISNPLPGVSSAYVIMGSDKRGTIYGLYELSEQSGVSPWYWFVPCIIQIRKHSNLYFTGNCLHGEPTVKYRGICASFPGWGPVDTNDTLFQTSPVINDEQPAIQSWAQEKYTNGTGPPFNHFFYSNVFELLLRLRANYLWPAMWSGMFYVDDKENAALADYYGIVMGTSHQEPMARASPMPLEESTNVKNLETIVDAQRKILAQVYNKSDATTIPQMWCLYQEVQAYYEDGMRVPDDVILLWADDNWGNIRRYPLENERNRTGGAGIYYHYRSILLGELADAWLVMVQFDLVGPPRSYKWTQSTQLEKVNEQMTLASDRGANSIWIVNVGDLKPNEMAIEYFIALGRDVNRWRNTQSSSDSVQTYITQWATREFNLPSKSDEIAWLVRNMTKFNARRKHELLSPTTYSLVNYHEAENIVAAWSDMVARSQSIYDSLPTDTKPAYFQLVHHPIKASSIVQNLYYTV